MCNLRQDGASIAQWLEHWSCKPGVVSSILTGGYIVEFKYIFFNLPIDQYILFFFNTMDCKNFKPSKNPALKRSLSVYMIYESIKTLKVCKAGFCTLNYVEAFNLRHHKESFSELLKLTSVQLDRCGRSPDINLSVLMSVLNLRAPNVF